MPQGRVKRVIYCPECGSVFNEEAGFCPKCDFDEGAGVTEIPPLADLWDLGLPELQALAESQGVRGWRRLKQKSLIWQLDQMRIGQVAEQAEQAEEDERQQNISLCTEQFIAAVDVRDVDAASQSYDALCGLTDEIHEDIILTMQWLKLPGQIAAALTVEDIPPLAFQIEDPEIQQAAHAMIEMIGHRAEVERTLAGIDHSSQIPEEMLGHPDPVVTKLAQDRHEVLAGAERADAEQEVQVQEMNRIRAEKIAELDAARDMTTFPGLLLEHADSEVRSHARKRRRELKHKMELLTTIESADDLDALSEALAHGDDDVLRAAGTKRRSLTRRDKRDLLKMIDNSLTVDNIPAEAFDHHDQEVVDAARRREEHFSRVELTLDSISQIYLAGPLDELLEHENASVREAARLRLRILDEVPDKLRHRGERSTRLVKMVDELAEQWVAEAEASQRAQQDAQGKADSGGFSLGDMVDVSYIGQRFTGTVQGFTADGEFVEIMNADTSMVWPVPFDCVVPL